MSQKFFPIKTDTACQLKWTWSTLHLYTGHTNSCHRVGASLLDVDTFFDFHNTDKKIQDRVLMLQGIWPTGGCEYCQGIEKVGGHSDRLFHLQIPDLSPPELDHDLNATHVTPRILEVYFDNRCNMSCIYCYDGYSSRIQQENERFGEFKQGSIEIKNIAPRHPRYHELQQQFWTWLEENHHHLRRLHVLGGEPFFQPQFDQCLDFLEKHPNPNLEFNVITNLKVNKQRLENFFERIERMVKQKSIKRLDMTCSIDCWGEEQEYIRHGIDMQQWQENFRYVAQHPDVVLNINQAITGLSIPTMKNLIEFLNSMRTHREIGHYFSVVTNKPWLNPDIFAPGFYDEWFDGLFATMPRQTWSEKQTYSMMQGLQHKINSTPENRDLINDLKIFLNEIDRRRESNWHRVFSWLERA